jgi:hypothetical protein
VPKGHKGWPLRAPADWLDHPYKMTGQAGEVTYISEPYSLSGDGYPGHTLYIGIRPSDGGKRSLAVDIADTYNGGGIYDYSTDEADRKVSRG